MNEVQERAERDRSRAESGLRVIKNMASTELEDVDVYCVQGRVGIKEYFT